MLGKEKNLLLDPFDRKIDYLRVSVTPHCNLRCLYCVPAMGCHVRDSHEFLSTTQIIRLAKILAGMGIRKIRLTGGEPLVRPDILDIVRGLATIPQVEDLALSTNGILLAQQARELRAAGLRRVNISLDSLKPEKFRFITRGGDFSKAWSGIQAALEAGLYPVKINVVLIKGFNEDEIADFAHLTRQYPIHVRFIELMPKGSGGFFRPEHFLSVGEAQEVCESLGHLQPTKKALASGENNGHCEPQAKHFAIKQSILLNARTLNASSKSGCLGDGIASIATLPRNDDLPLVPNGPAALLRYVGAPGCLGFIGAITRCFCGDCNRLRLTAGGVLRPCLDWEEGIDLKGPMHRGATDEDLEELVRLAILIKPKSHRMELGSATHEREPMCAIGG